MNSCDVKGERVGLARLTTVERVVVLVSRANFEIELGGLDAFYYNSAGNEAVPTVDALVAVRATPGGIRVAGGQRIVSGRVAAS
jgi:hypothetical protein